MSLSRLKNVFCLKRVTVLPSIPHTEQLLVIEGLRLDDLQIVV